VAAPARAGTPVHVAVRREGERVIVAVADEGPGIAPGHGATFTVRLPAARRDFHRAAAGGEWVRGIGVVAPAGAGYGP
jgi:signal transduction histidine kinase